MKKENLKKRIYTSLGLFIFTFLIAGSSVILIFGLIILGVLSILEFLNLTKKIIKSKFSLFVINSFLIIYISIFCLLFFYFTNFLQLKIILFSLLLTCVASDIGGFVFGNLFKGPKLTKISPKKTYSGAVGGYFLSIIFVFFFISYWHLFNIETSNKFFDLKIFVLTLMISTVSQIGDLIVSYFKRSSKIKDTGNIIPGHGGLLDRIDGMIFAFPFFYLIKFFLHIN